LDFLCVRYWRCAIITGKVSSKLTAYIHIIRTRKTYTVGLGGVGGVGVNCFSIAPCSVAMISNPTVGNVCGFYSDTMVFSEIKLFAVM